MAITIDDFSKIWASTSPLTPYEFSESNYKEGWNFIGGTPPSRQMWDFIQKHNDEKLKYLLDNFDDYLPLTGGTMTGNITLTSGEINNVNDSTIVKVQGGTEEDKGGRLVVFGKDFSDAPALAGCAELTASDGSNSKSLRAYPDGTLTWGAKSVFWGECDINQTYKNGYEINAVKNILKQWTRAYVGAGASNTWTFPKPFDSDVYIAICVASNSASLVITSQTETALTVRNDGTAAYLFDLVIGVPA